MSAEKDAAIAALHAAEAALVAAVEADAEVSTAADAPSATVAVADAPELKPDVAPTASAPLRLDGPTLDEYVKAGYLAENYPPSGYAVREDEPAASAPVHVHGKQYLLSMDGTYLGPTAIG